MFVGIDWASESHAVHVQNDSGRKLAAPVEHHEGLVDARGVNRQAHI